MRSLRGHFHKKNTTTTTAVAPVTTASTTTTTVVSEQAPIGIAETRIEQVELPKEMRERPAVIHENIRREEVEEIQPVIHRERETTELRQLTQPIYEQAVRPIQIHEQVLAAEQRPAVIGAAAVTQAAPVSTSVFAGVERKVVEKPAMVVETVKRHIIEEVQPIIYKEIHEPHIIRVTKPIYERIVETPLVVQQTLAPRNVTVQLPVQQQQEIITTTTSTTAPTATAAAVGTTRRGFHGHHHHSRNHPAAATTSTTSAPIYTTTTPMVTTAGVPQTVSTIGPSTTVTAV